MDLISLVKLATVDLVDMAVRGKLSGSSVWVALSGARRYFSAIASGDVADAATQADRASKCWACKSSTSKTTQIEATGVFCGVPFREGITTCGCLVSVRVNGQTLPAGKTVVASEQCPQGKW